MNSTQRKRVSNEDFVVSWQLSSSVKEIAEKTNLAEATVIARKNTLARLGVNLKAIGKTKKRAALDTVSLNTLANTCLANASTEHAVT